MNVYDTANKLAKEIKESKEYKEYNVSIKTSLINYQDKDYKLNTFFML